MRISKVLPKICKHHSCLKEADWEFTDNGVKEFPKRRTYGYSCDDHRDDVKKMFEMIYNKK